MPDYAGVQFEEAYIVRLYPPCGHEHWNQYRFADERPAEVDCYCPVCDRTWTVRLSWHHGRVVDAWMQVDATP